MNRMILLTACVVLFAACDQNHPVESVGEAGRANRSAESTGKDFSFENIVRNLDNPSVQYNARGHINYTITLLPILHTNIVEVSINFSAELDNPLSDRVPVHVKDSSTDRVVLGLNGTGSLVKQYEVEELQTNLFVRYDVTMDELSVNELWLQDGSR